eukprot:2455819-Prymnesium_polylepis.1
MLPAARRSTAACASNIRRFEPIEPLSADSEFTSLPGARAQQAHARNNPAACALLVNRRNGRAAQTSSDR